MSRALLVHYAVRTTTLLLLAVVAWLALSGGLSQLGRPLTTSQLIETIVQLACGVLSLLAMLTCYWKQQWAVPVRRAWAATLVATVSLSTLVWGPPMPLITLLLTGVALLVAWAMTRALRATVRPPRLPDGV